MSHTASIRAGRLVEAELRRHLVDRDAAFVVEDGRILLVNVAGGVERLDPSIYASAARVSGMPDIASALLAYRCSDSAVRVNNVSAARQTEPVRVTVYA